MASLKDIRARIDSTKNTQQITKAMKLVSAAKLRKAQLQVVHIRPYAKALNGIIDQVASSEGLDHPLLRQPVQIQKILVVVLSSDRGLCGGFNAQIQKFTEQFLRTQKATYEKFDFVFMGKKVAEYFARRGVQPLQAFQRIDKDISFDFAKKFADQVMEYFRTGDYDEVRVIFNEFKSAISQKVTVKTLLPLLRDENLDPVQIGENKAPADILFEPEPKLILDKLLEKHFTAQIFRVMAESVASEHGARMTAMENATNNARDVLNRLTLTYNKLRQEKITTELTEIVSGAEAL